MKNKISALIALAVLFGIAFWHSFSRIDAIETYHLDKLLHFAAAACLVFLLPSKFQKRWTAVGLVFLAGTAWELFEYFVLTQLDWVGSQRNSWWYLWDIVGDQTVVLIGAFVATSIKPHPKIE